MADTAQFGVRITASDKTAKGVKAAEKSLGQIPKHVSAVNRRAAAEGEKHMAGAGRSMVRTLGSVEQASARLFGGRSLTGGLTSRLGALGDVASSLGTGMGEASAAGGLLEGAIAGVGVAVGATVGILAAAAYGAFKLADGWAKGAAAIGRAAEVAGVGAKALQEFNAAGERVGVDKGASSGALGGLSQTLNDARYGRNQNAQAMLGVLGVSMKLKQDGTVDVEAMLPAIADAIAKQSSSGRRTAAGALGISQAALPMFTQGGQALSSNMTDADKNAAVISDGSIEMAKRVVRKSAMVGQSKDRLASQAGEAVAGAAERNGVYDAFVDGGRFFTGSVDKFSGAVTTDFKPGAAKIDRASDKLDRAAGRFEGAVNYAGGGGGRLSRDAAISEARKGVRLRNKLIAAGFSSADATALSANAVRESGADYRAKEKGGGGVGLWQWTNKARKNNFKRIMGVSVDQSTEDQQIAFLKWELENTEKGGWQKAHRDGADAGAVAAGFTRHVERPKDADRDAAERAAVARALDAIPVHVTIEHRNAPPGTRTTVRAGTGPKPAVSRALEPAYGR